MNYVSKHLETTVHQTKKKMKFKKCIARIDSHNGIDYKVSKQVTTHSRNKVIIKSLIQLELIL